MLNRCQLKIETRLLLSQSKRTCTDRLHFNLFKKKTQNIGTNKLSSIIIRGLTKNVRAWPLKALNNDVFITHFDREKPKIQLPLGIKDFATLRSTLDMVYIDKTHYIKLLEDSAAPAYVLHRPPKFGKSLFLSTLAHFYDMNYEPKFIQMFDKLAISKYKDLRNRNKHVVLKLDFSKFTIRPNSDPLKDFTKMVNNNITKTCRAYGIDATKVNEHRCDFSLSSLTMQVRRTFHGQAQLVILVDDYDTLFNWAMESKIQYELLEPALGAVKNLFNAMKGHSQTEILRIFMTGVNPIILYDHNGGMDIATNITNKDKFEGLCGLNYEQVSTLTSHLRVTFGDLEYINEHYGGYCFVESPKDSVFNPTQVFKHFQSGLKRIEFNLLSRFINSHSNVITTIAPLLEGPGASMPAYIHESFYLPNFHYGSDQTFNFMSLLYYAGVIRRGEDAVTVKTTNLSQYKYLQNLTKVNK